MEPLVTGEGVALELRVARLPTRALGFFLDALLLLALVIGVNLVVGALVAAADPALAGAVVLVGVVTVFVAVPVTIETLTRGRSLGKLALGLRVVRDDGGPIRFRHALTRGLAGFFVDFWVTGGVGAVVSSILSKDGKRVGDLLAGTLVVKERTGTKVLALPPVPVPLEHWARTLELTRLPDDLALAVRTYLTRGATMSPPAAAAMGAELARAVAAHVRPAPPPGTPDWAYLAAVLGERRRRAEASLHAYLVSAQAWSAVEVGAAPRPRGGAPLQREPFAARSSAAPSPAPGSAWRPSAESQPAASDGGFVAPR